MQIKTILIDDERKSIAILKNKLERYCPNVEIIGETQYPKEGVSMINELKPQLVFLDVAMPEMSGFDLLAEINNPSFEVIFATAFDQYALDAIKHCAIGYLVKPVDNEDLVIAVENARINILEKTALQKNRQFIENMGVRTFQKKKIIISTQDGLEFIKVETIIHCEGVDGYTKLHFTDRTPMLSSKNIGHFYKLLKNQGFYMIHKSHIINLSHITKYLNEGIVVMSNDQQLSVSRNRRNDFLNSLKSGNDQIH